jgi:2-dehydro-3-deoxyphosphooctonate aldolase (KDO 8-P synthase)
VKSPKKAIRIGSLKIGGGPLFLIGGPCVIETESHPLKIARRLKEITDELGIPFIFKASYDKANRSSIGSFRGVGLERGLDILATVKAKVGVPILTDVHETSHVEHAAKIADVLQIPAFLCRQTDLLVVAARTGRAINIKKGQFLAPWDMKNVAAKCHEAGNDNILLCERGASFGYNTLVSDMRSLPILADTGYPVIFDATHSVQQPGGQGTSSGGQREFVPVLARAAIAVGVAGVFMETHRDPDKAPSDGPNMVPFRHMEKLMATLLEFDRLAKSRPIESIAP